MNITVQKLPKSEIKLTIELTEEATKKYFQKAVQQLSSMVKIPGFRSGHIPIEILKKHISQENIEAQMIDIAIPDTYSKTIIQEKITVVSRPKIQIISQNPLRYEATVAIYPEVKVSDYEKIKIPKEEIKIDSKEINDVLNHFQKSHAKYKEIDRPAKKGDRVEINFEGFDEGGATLENTKSKNHPLVIGEGSLVEGFEHELIGMKKNDRKDFTITFPEDYFHKKFQNKKVTFKVELLKVEEVQLPELTAEFIKQTTGEEKSMEEIKKSIEENLNQDKVHQAKIHREDQFLEKIIELTKLELPEILVQEEIDSMIEEFKNELENKGITLEKFLEANKKNLDGLRESRRKEAEKRLTLRFGLHEIFDKEKIEVSPEELQQSIEHIIKLYPDKEQYKIRKEYEEGGYILRRLENKLKMDKLFERFLEK